jgi:BirA family biotin operon repressor/biotin-[acetyl-CoA-carboxylase] ligase
VVSDLLQPYLAGLPLGGCRYFSSIGSTNDEALAWAEEGAPDLALVVADAQSAGRGRRQRQWVTYPGAALAFSLVLRPSRSECEHLARFSGLGAVAVRRAISDQFGLPAQVKWPNDVLLCGCKTAGVLVEAVWAASSLQALVLGIGVNISPASVPPAASLAFPAICVEAALQRPVDRWSLLHVILVNFLLWRSKLETDEFLSEWEVHLAYKGEWVCITSANGTEQSGCVTGIAPDGSLRLRDQDGQEFVTAEGDVKLRRV